MFSQIVFALKKAWPALCECLPLPSLQWAWQLSQPWPSSSVVPWAWLDLPSQSLEPWKEPTKLWSVHKGLWPPWPHFQGTAQSASGSSSGCGIMFAYNATACRSAKALWAHPWRWISADAPGPCQPHQGKRSNPKTLSHLTWCWLRFWHPGPWSQPLLSWSLQGWSSLPSGFEGSCVPGLLGPSQKASQLVPVISTGNQVVQEIREATWRSSVQEPLWNYMNP